MFTIYFALIARFFRKQINIRMAVKLGRSVSLDVEALEDRCVPSVNHAPVGVSNTVATLQSSAKVFQASDFCFSDPDDEPSPNHFQAVVFDSLPVFGTFTNNGQNVSTNQAISVSDINAGHVRFTPENNVTGNSLTGFYFRVRDDGGTAGDPNDMMSFGQDTDLTARYMAISVVPDAVFVTSTADDGAGTLRQAIRDAVDGMTIRFDLGDPDATEPYQIHLLTQIESDKSLTIDGQGYASRIQIVGDQSGGRLLSFHGARAVNETISALDLRYGDAREYAENAPGGKTGGAVYVRGSLSLIQDNFLTNWAVSGGAIAVEPVSAQDSLSIAWSRFDSNNANAGGAVSMGTAASEEGGNITVSNSYFRHNHANVDNGGAILAMAPAPGATCFLISSRFEGNTASSGGGGAIWTTYNLTVMATDDELTGGAAEFTGNSAFAGGAIDWLGAPRGVDLQPNIASFIITNVTFDSNTAASSGGAIHAFGSGIIGSVTESISGCLFVSNIAGAPGNPAGGRGGAVLVSNNTAVGSTNIDLMVMNSTFYANSAVNDGAGVAIIQTTGGTGANTASIWSDTFYLNIAGRDGGGLWTGVGGTVEIGNSIIAGNFAFGWLNGSSGGFDIDGLVCSLGYNLIGTSAGNAGSAWMASDFTQANGQPPRDPGLDTVNGLRDNGGPTETIAVLQSSDAYQQGDPDYWGMVDQRGLTRRGQDGDENLVVTIGAFDPNAI